MVPTCVPIEKEKSCCELENPAISPECKLLGIQDTDMGTREESPIRQARRFHGMRAPDLGHKRMAEVAETRPSMRPEYVADREADPMARMARAQALGTATHSPVRAIHNR